MTIIILYTLADIKFINNINLNPPCMIIRIGSYECQVGQHNVPFNEL